MRKIICTLFITVFVITASHAQIRVGPYFGYGEGLNLWGIGAYAELSLNDRVSISPFFTQYFPESFNNNPRRSAWELNGNVNYYVIRGYVGYLYGLAGLSYTNIRTRTSTPTADEVDNNGNLGFNFGLGTMVNVNDSLYPFAEGKYTAGGYSQVGLIFGIKFQLGRRALRDDY